MVRGRGPLGDLGGAPARLREGGVGRGGTGPAALGPPVLGGAGRRRTRRARPRPGRARLAVRVRGHRGRRRPVRPLVARPRRAGRPAGRVRARPAARRPPGGGPAPGPRRRAGRADPAVGRTRRHAVAGPARRRHRGGRGRPVDPGDGARHRPGGRPPRPAAGRARGPRPRRSPGAAARRRRRRCPACSSWSRPTGPRGCRPSRCGASASRCPTGATTCCSACGGTATGRRSAPGRSTPLSTGCGVRTGWWSPTSTPTSRARTSAARSTSRTATCSPVTRSHRRTSSLVVGQAGRRRGPRPSAGHTRPARAGCRAGADRARGQPGTAQPAAAGRGRHARSLACWERRTRAPYWRRARSTCPSGAASPSWCATTRPRPPLLVKPLTGAVRGLLDRAGGGGGAARDRRGHRRTRASPGRARVARQLVRRRGGVVNGGSGSVSPLVEIERAVQERAKDISLEMSAPGGEAKLRALIAEEVGPLERRPPAGPAGLRRCPTRRSWPSGRSATLPATGRSRRCWPTTTCGRSCSTPRTRSSCVVIAARRGYHDEVFHDDDHVVRTLTKLLDDASTAHRKLDPAEGLQDAQLDDGARVHIVHGDIARGGHVLVNIRKFTGIPFRSLDELVERDMLTRPGRRVPAGVRAGRSCRSCSPGRRGRARRRCCRARPPSSTRRLRVVVAEEVFESDVPVPNVAQMQTRPARADRPADRPAAPRGRVPAHGARRRDRRRGARPGGPAAAADAVVGGERVHDDPRRLGPPGAHPPAVRLPARRHGRRRAAAGGAELAREREHRRGRPLRPHAGRAAGHRGRRSSRTWPAARRRPTSR